MVKPFHPGMLETHKHNTAVPTSCTIYYAVTNHGRFKLRADTDLAAREEAHCVGVLVTRIQKVTTETLYCKDCAAYGEVG